MNEQTINKGLMIAGGLLGLGLLGYLFFREKEATVEAEFTIIEDSKPNKTEKPVIIKKEVSVVKMQPIIPVEKEKKVIIIKPEVLPEPNDDFPLKLDSKGVRVRQLQVYLLKNHGTAGLVNDVFDLLTQGRVLRFLKVKEVSEHLFQERNMANLKSKTKNVRKKKH
tara:strand:+ start:6245 stop:6742 length:498 start_codon:yes stop_codon:yes gene_type:complete